jgi:hypothetical protein
MNLFDITDEYRAQLAALSELDVPPEVVQDTLDGLQGELEHKLRAVIAYGLNIRAQAEAEKAAADRMAERAKADNKRADGLLAYALQAMQATGLPGIKTAQWEAKPAKKTASVEITDPNSLPDDFMRHPAPPPAEPDKAAIAAALKAGQEVPGARLVQGWRLAVR